MSVVPKTLRRELFKDHYEPADSLLGLPTSVNSDFYREQSDRFINLASEKIELLNAVNAIRDAFLGSSSGFEMPSETARHGSPVIAFQEQFSFSRHMSDEKLISTWLCMRVRYVFRTLAIGKKMARDSAEGKLVDYIASLAKNGMNSLEFRMSGVSDLARVEFSQAWDLKRKRYIHLKPNEIYEVVTVRTGVKDRVILIIEDTNNNSYEIPLHRLLQSSDIGNDVFAHSMAAFTLEAIEQWDALEKYIMPFFNSDTPAPIEKESKIITGSDKILELRKTIPDFAKYGSF